MRPGRASRILLFITFLAVLCCAVLCQAEDGHGAATVCGIPRKSLGLEAFGRSAPSGARTVPFCDYVRLVKSGAVEQFSAKILRRQKAAAHRSDAASADVIEDYLEAHPEATDLRSLVDSRVRSGPGIQRMANGENVITLPGGQREVTLSRSFLLKNVADSIGLAADRDRQLAMYRELYDELPPAIFDPATGAGGDLPTPASLADVPIPDVQRALSRMARLAPVVEKLVQPGPAISSLGCDYEFGASRVFGDIRYDDADGNTVKFYRDAQDQYGIYSSFAFANKPYLTCVRDQANRGTCVEFGVLSATEMMIARNTATYVNLSEQDTEEHYKLGIWGNAQVWYGDGGGGGDLVTRIIANNYYIPYEDSWDYNPSLSRVTLPNGYFEFSCNSPYPSKEACSNTSPQAPMVCGQDPQTGDWDCSLEDAGIPGSPHTITAGGNFWLPAPFSALSAELIRLHLALNHGVTIGLELTNQFMGLAYLKVVDHKFVPTHYGGYLTFDPNDLKTDPGGHELHVVGFISNEDLKALIPTAPLAPSVGYFIVKNSWGPWWGDAGFGYLPWDYVVARGNEAVAITGVQ